MSRTQGILLLLLALVGLLVGWLALRNPQPPLLPDNAAHRWFPGADYCLTCHGPEGVQPRPKNHPMGNDCNRCHGLR